MTDQNLLPLVTVAVPLFRSLRFVDNISRNLRNFDYPNLEIIISDRHCHDHALDLLENRLGRQKNFVFLKGTDCLSWVEHYNFLLQRGKGEFFMWMPHDDLYPAHYVSSLVAYLREYRTSLGAFGQVRTICEDKYSSYVFRPPPLSSHRGSRLKIALTWLLLWDLWIPIRGLFRRQALLNANLFVRKTRDTMGADVYWIFGILLKGPLGYAENCYCTKRFFSLSTHAQWRIKHVHILDGYRVLRSYLRDYTTSRSDYFFGRLILASMTGIRLVTGWLPALRQWVERLRQLIK